jgi:hypothetical protein
MEPKKSKKRSFSMELNSKSDLKSITMTNGPRESVLVEGTIGELVQLGFTEGVILEIIGDRGILRVDIGEDEIVQANLEPNTGECRKNSDASSKITKIEAAKGGETNGREN